VNAKPNFRKKRKKKVPCVQFFFWIVCDGKKQLLTDSFGVDLDEEEVDDDCD